MSQGHAVCFGAGMRIHRLAVAIVVLSVAACTSNVETNPTSHGGSTSAGTGGAGTSTATTTSSTGGGGDPGPVSCAGNGSCADDEYCQFPAGACDASQAGLGVCTKKPAECPVFEAPSYACGCDGKTYESACEAAQAGVGISDDGGCQAPAGRFWCGGDRTCDAVTQFCWDSRPGCDNGTGSPSCFECWPLPDACPTTASATCDCVKTNATLQCASNGECGTASDGTITLSCEFDI